MLLYFIDFSKLIIEWISEIIEIFLVVDFVNVGIFIIIIILGPL